MGSGTFLRFRPEPQELTCIMWWRGLLKTDFSLPGPGRGNPDFFSLSLYLPTAITWPDLDLGSENLASFLHFSSTSGREELP